MTELSQGEIDIITKYSLGDSLDRVRDLLQEAGQPRLISYDGTADDPDQIHQMAVSKLLITLMAEKAAFELRPLISKRDIASELSRLFTHLREDGFRSEHYRSIIQLILQNAQDVDIWNAVLSLIATASQATPPPRPIASLQQTPWLRNRLGGPIPTDESGHGGVTKQCAFWPVWPQLYA
ncbi:hypothetical protein EMCG_05079 [[Emmonsia] crescens]|uniref:Uncharacterized protein n=1 Tax=[Emmonsia] crescens TaxID=73230 RepID=A0A0G2HPY9_9EURO|nr:hypothetical protein EMCG_05079 [Emmonsia crescens UAMH 3008]